MIEQEKGKHEQVSSKSVWRRSIRWVLPIVVTFLVVGVVVYNLVTSSWFFERFVWPRVGRELGVNIKVGRTEFRPLSRFVVDGLWVSVGATSEPPVLVISGFRVEYNLLRLLRGKVALGEVTIDSPSLCIVRREDGRLNIDPILNRFVSKGAPEAVGKEAPAKPLDLDIGSFKIQNGRIAVTNLGVGGRYDAILVEDLVFSCTNLRNGSLGKVSLSGRLSSIHASGTNVVPDWCKGVFTNGVVVDLSEVGQVRGIKLRGGIQAETGTGAFSHLTGAGLNLRAEVTGIGVDEFRAEFVQGGNSIGLVTATGPFSITNGTGRLALVVSNLTGRALELVTLPFGVGFGNTRIDSTNEISMTDFGRRITVDGYLEADRVSISRGGRTTPVVSVRGKYRLMYDQAEGKLSIEGLNLQGTGTAGGLLNGEIIGPVSIGGQSLLMMGEGARIGFEVKDFDLGWVGEFFDSGLSSGRLGLSFEVKPSGQAGVYAMRIGASVVDLAVGRPQPIEKIDCQLAGKVDLTRDGELSIHELMVRVAHAGEPVLDAGFVGKGDLHRGLGEVQAAMDVILPRMMKMTPASGIVLDSGQLKLKSRVTGSFARLKVDFNGGIEGVAGRLFGGRLLPSEVQFGGMLERSNSVLSVGSLRAQVLRNGRAVFSLEASGFADLPGFSEAQMKLSVPICTESMLASFLPGLFGRDGISRADFAADLLFEKAGDPWRLFFGVVGTNIVVDPARSRNAQNSLGVAIDLALVGRGDKSVRVERGDVVLIHPSEATNRLTIAGNLEGLSSRAIKGEVSLSSAKLDLTPLIGFLQRPSSGRDTVQQVEHPAFPFDREPVLKRLPCEKLDVQVRMDRVVMGELDISGLVLDAKVASNRAEISKLACLVNGGVLAGKGMLGMGGDVYEYAFALAGRRIPLAPLANTFSSQYRNKAMGELNLTLGITGRGFTGPSLQTNLAGYFLANMTNSAVQLVGQRAQLLLTPVALVLGIDELLRTSLTNLDVQMGIQRGNIHVTNFMVSCDLLKARTQGRLIMGSNLWDSTFEDWPIEIALPVGIAKKARLISDPSLYPEGLVPMPVFAKLAGTLGKPQIRTDKLVIASFIAKSASGLPGSAAQKAGQLLDALSGAVTGSTNQATTNVFPLPVNPLDFLRSR